MRPRNGPPLAVKTRLSGSPSCAHWKSAECSLSTGISTPRPAEAASGEVAGCDEALLVRERERDAVFERPHRRYETREAERRVEDDVGLGTLEELGRIAADLRQRARPSIGVDPEVAATSSRPGFASITSSAWRPIEPVAPSRAIRFIPTVCPSAEPVLVIEDHEVRGRRRKEQGVEPVEHAAVAAEERARVLHAGMSRFSSDSKRSPSGAATASTTPRTIDCPIVRKCCL